MTDNLERRYLDARSQLNLRADQVEGEDGKRGGGYAALYNSESFDLGGFTEVLAPGAFARSLAKVADGSANVFLFWQHDSNTILASTRSGSLALTDDDTGLAFDFDVDGLTDQQAKTLKRGDLQVSFGFYIVGQEWSERPDGSFLRTITDLELTEVSLVTYPAYGATTVAMRSLEAFRATTKEPEESVEANEDWKIKAANEINLRLRLA